MPQNLSRMKVFLGQEWVRLLVWSQRHTRAAHPHPKIWGVSCADGTATQFPAHATKVAWESNKFDVSLIRCGSLPIGKRGI